MSLANGRVVVQPGPRLALRLGLVLAAVMAWLLALRLVGGLLAVAPLDPAPPTAVPAAPAVSWATDDADTGRRMDPPARQAVQAAYLLAWRALDDAYPQRHTDDLASAFSGPALEAATSAVRASASQGAGVMRIDESHALRLHLFAPNGSLAAFSDQARVREQVTDPGGTVVLNAESDATYNVLMRLSDSGWRVEQWQRRDGTAGVLGAAAP